MQQATGGKGVETFGGDEIDYEAVAAAQPDLILGIYESIDQPTYDRLSQIAPTVVQSSAFPDEETPWDVQLVTTGQALGREEQALALVDQVNAKIAEAKAAIPGFAGKVLVVGYGPGERRPLPHRAGRPAPHAVRRAGFVPSRPGDVERAAVAARP